MSGGYNLVTFLRYFHGVNAEGFVCMEGGWVVQMKPGDPSQGILAKFRGSVQ